MNQTEKQKEPRLPFLKDRSQKQSETEVERFSPDPEAGLTADQVALRESQGCRNEMVKGGTKTIPQIILSNLLTYYNLLFALIALALIWERSFSNLTFLIVVFANIVIGTVQEINAKKTLDKLNLLSAPKVTAIRDGQAILLDAEDLVLDDVVQFASGQQICADAMLLDGELTVNESLVTGESDEVSKHPGDTLLSGSFIISGKGRGRLDKVGKDSFVSKMSLDAKRIKKKQQPGMMRSLTLLVKIIGIIIVPFGVIMFINQLHTLGVGEKQAVESTAAALIGMIPEGLYLLTSVALAASVIRLAKKKTLVHDLKCIEALARVDVLCVDKTGTITEDRMEVCEIVPISDRTNDEIQTILKDYAGAMNADNATMKALQSYFATASKSSRSPAALIGFSSATKYSALSFGSGESYLMGAPEFILKERYGAFRGSIEAQSAKGRRVLLLASYETENGGEWDIFSKGTLSPDCVTPIALVTLMNPVRSQAKSTFSYFVQQGVRVKVISGDNPVTVSEAARQAGIPGYDRYVDASLLDTPDKLAKAVEDYQIFGRVTPDQKRQMVRALKKAGHTVAMTGDGVNDVLALKDSDCSVAMASGSEAAANVSDLVLLDSDFSAMPAVVAEGRRVINNIERSAALFLVKNIFSFIMAFAALFIAFPYPFTPSQLSLVNMMMIGIPSFFLALAPSNGRITGRFLSNVLYRAFPPALTAVFAVSGTLLFSYAFQIPYEETSTAAVILFGVVSWIMLYRVCLPIKLWRMILWGSMGGLFVAALFILRDFFSLSPLSLGTFLVVAVFLLLMIPAIRTITTLQVKGLDFLSSLWHKIRHKKERKNDSAADAE